MIGGHEIAFGVVSRDPLWDVLATLLRGYAEANAALIRRDPGRYPPIADTVVMYNPRPFMQLGRLNAQRVLLAPALLAAGVGDCLSIACYEAGRCRAEGSRPAWPVVTPGDQHAAGHVVLRFRDGAVVDPTLGLEEVP